MNKKNNLKYENVDSAMSIVGEIINLLTSFAFTAVMIFLFSTADVKLVFIPFIVCGTSLFIRSIINIIHTININRYIKSAINADIEKQKEIAKTNDNIIRAQNTMEYIYYFGFLSFLFGGLIYGNYESILTWNEGGNESFFLSLPFWFIGIFIIYILVKKKHK